MTCLSGSAWHAQQERNAALTTGSTYMHGSQEAAVLPFHLDLAANTCLSPDDELALQALEIEGARIAIKSLASLAAAGDLDHLGGGLDLIPALTMTLAVTDYQKIEFTIENAHCSIGYYSCLAALGFLKEEVVVEKFRRSLDIAGHVSWVPGGTQLSGGRLGVMVPTGVGQALGKRARLGKGSWVVCHCGDAGWISGQALNGFNVADLHRAPISFVMHRNGIQLSGSNKQIMDKDPRPIIAALGIELIELSSLHDPAALWAAYREAYAQAQNGRPTLIYPTGYRSSDSAVVDLNELGRRYGILKQTADFAAKNKVALDTKIWIPGSLMSYRDVEPMLECVFLVNDLPGGKGHHDGGMKGRNLVDVLANPMLTPTKAQSEALARLHGQPRRRVACPARPAPGSPNLVLPADVVAKIELPGAGKSDSPRTGSEKAYQAIAKTFPKAMFVVSCDLDPSTKLGAAVKLLPKDQCFEVSIEEQVATLMCDGLATATREPQLNVVSTFTAFFEGIAREGFEMWRYQRNLNGVNEGLNVCFHLSHVGANTGRDHYSGWGLDWITLGLGYLPYLHRFYTPADARAAFLAVCDLAAHYGGHIIGIPRDKLPILTRENGQVLWETTSPWEAVTKFRETAGARRAILAVGATASIAEKAIAKLRQEGLATDAYVVNGFPIPEATLAALLEQYRGGLVTIEDGIIATRATGLRGFAGLIAGVAAAKGVPTDHLGILDPRVAPAEDFGIVWEHFGMTPEALAAAVRQLA